MIIRRLIRTKIYLKRKEMHHCRILFCNRFVFFVVLPIINGNNKYKILFSNHPVKSWNFPLYHVLEFIYLLKYYYHLIGDRQNNPRILVLFPNFLIGEWFAMKNKAWSLNTSTYEIRQYWGVTFDPQRINLRECFHSNSHTKCHVPLIGNGWKVKNVQIHRENVTYMSK